MPGPGLEPDFPFFPPDYNLAIVMMEKGTANKDQEKIIAPKITASYI